MSSLKNLWGKLSSSFEDEGYEYEDDVYEEEPAGQAGALPARSVRPRELVIIRPGSYHDARAAVDALKNDMIVVVELGHIDAATAARMVDFVSGAVYLLNASIQLLNEDTLILAPASVTLETDDLVRADLFPQWRPSL
jgi:cell division inhibitor SepF